MILRNGDLSSINAMSPDANALRVVNASDCTSDAPPNSQMLHRGRSRDESATLAVQATAKVPCFNAFIGSDLRDRMYLLDGMNTAGVGRAHRVRP